MNPSSSLLKLINVGPTHCRILRLQSVLAKTAKPIQIPDSINVDGQTYNTDSTYNLTPKIHALLQRQLLHEKFNPLNLLKQRIVNHFYKFHLKRSGSGSPLFAVCENQNRVVSCFENFDSLLTPADHVSRQRSDTYYVNKDHVLRGHTSAHQLALARSGLDAFLCVGDVYRRDEIDRTHYPCFHQMEAVRLFTHDQLFGSKLKADTELFERDGERTVDKQERLTRDTSLALQISLKSTLEALFQDLFGADVQMRWVDAYFPFTHPSFELEIYHNGHWMEMLGCGVMEQNLVDSTGALSKVGWAFGMGLERLAMIMYNIPDIRLFWSKDTGFLSQFDGKTPDEVVKFKPVSLHPQLYMDISYWLPSGATTNDMKSDVMDVIRQIGGDLVEQVQLIDEFENKKKQRTSQCFRITYRSNDRVLAKEEVNVLHAQIRDELVNIHGVEIR